MAKQTINLGTAANDRTGTNLRAAFDICNDNFTELYDVCVVDGTIKAKYVKSTGALSDPPTISEVQTLLGITAANADAGCIFIINDSGNGVLYKLTSDGTDWFVWKSSGKLSV